MWDEDIFSTIRAPLGPLSRSELSKASPQHRSTAGAVGTKLIPKLKSGQDFKVEVGFSVTVDSGNALHLKTEVQQILQDLGLAEQLTLELEP